MAPHANEHSASGCSTWASATSLRTSFTLAMSSMYRNEVPLYGDLVRIVNEVNAAPAQSRLDSKVRTMRFGTRLDIERHGAIRLGTAEELNMMRRVFAIIGLSPVGYYDLSEAGLPMHATCFRPLDAAALSENPFRVFTSVLRPELLKNQEAKDLAVRLLSERSIFSGELLSLLDQADKQGGRLTQAQGIRFVPEAIRTFGWQSTAAASYEEYKTLASEHPILADIACFRTAHINHLTPRTLDIVEAQEKMLSEGLEVKDRIEGPPLRKCPILLRQTSFLAIQEPIMFSQADHGLVEGRHKARFGEIEERGAAVTSMGRELYDSLLAKAMQAAKSSDEPVSAASMDALVAEKFQEYPDTWDELRKGGLIYYGLQPTSKATSSQLSKPSYKLDELIVDGWVDTVPITYEDFLPLSAAGIFQSNLGVSGTQDVQTCPDVDGIERALGVKLADPDEMYARMQAESLEECAGLLGVRIEV